MPEEGKEETIESVKDVLAVAVGCEIKFELIGRVGKEVGGRARPVRISLECQEEKGKILKGGGSN